MSYRLQNIPWQWIRVKNVGAATFCKMVMYSRQYFFDISRGDNFWPVDPISKRIADSNSAGRDPSRPVQKLGVSGILKKSIFCRLWKSTVSFRCTHLPLLSNCLIAPPFSQTGLMKNVVGIRGDNEQAHFVPISLFVQRIFPGQCRILHRLHVRKFAKILTRKRA